ncbi:hypothetical protein [Methanothermobacter tenebrarum]
MKCSDREKLEYSVGLENVKPVNKGGLGVGVGSPPRLDRLD